jgi:hypothetical protein
MSGGRLLPDPLDGAPEAPERREPEPAPPWGQRPPPPPQERPAFPLPATPVQAAPPPSEPTPYAARFQLILGALLGIAAVAVVAALLIGTGPSAAPSGNWSSWKPDTGKAGPAAQEIANHVAPGYRLDSGGQLVAVTGGQLKVADLPVRLALAQQGNVSVLNGDGVLYTLCGLGPKCSILSGKPSPQRHLLLRREALELALYTFRYVRGTDYVVALLPPRKGTDPNQAMFFRKDDLSQQLDRPVNTTLPAPPPRSNTLNAVDVSTLQALTARRLFQFKFEQGQDASVFLVLSPFATG